MAKWYVCRYIFFKSQTLRQIPTDAFAPIIATQTLVNAPNVTDDFVFFFMLLNSREITKQRGKVEELRCIKMVRVQPLLCEIVYILLYSGMPETGTKEYLTRLVFHVGLVKSWGILSELKSTTRLYVIKNFQND